MLRGSCSYGSPTIARFEASHTKKQCGSFKQPNTIVYTHCGRLRSRWGCDEEKPLASLGPT